MPGIDWIRKVCLALPEAKEKMQWGENLCFKVRGKIFAIVDLAEGNCPPICFKCSPEKFFELVEIDGIEPAPYVGRHKWVLVSRSEALSSENLANLIRQSYRLVVAKIPRKKSGGGSGKKRQTRAK